MFIEKEYIDLSFDVRFIEWTKNFWLVESIWGELLMRRGTWLFSDSIGGHGETKNQAFLGMSIDSGKATEFRAPPPLKFR